MEYSAIFNKTDYIILEMLIVEECNSPFKSLSKPYIIKESGFSHVKVQQVLKSFQLVGFVKEGTKDGNKKTYYYTQEGKNHFMQIFEYEEEDMEDLIYNLKESRKNKE